MAGWLVLHIVLRNLTLVDFGGFGEKIHREAFLQQYITLIFFVSQNAYYCSNLPGFFPGWQDTDAGRQEVTKALRRIIYLKYKIKDHELFDKAYKYVEMYY